MEKNKEKKTTQWQTWNMPNTFNRWFAAIPERLMTKTLAAMLDDKNNKAYYNSFVTGHPTWQR